MAEMYQSSQQQKIKNASELNQKQNSSESQKGPENTRNAPQNNKIYFNEEPFYASLNEGIAMKQPTANVNYVIQPQRIDVEMLKGGFGPEVLAFSSELNRNSTGPPVRGNRVNDKNNHHRMGSYPTQNKTIPHEQHMPPMNPQGDQYQHFNLQPGMFSQPINMQNSQFQQISGPMQPQVHFIANQQKFYQISPAREVVSAANNPGIHLIYGEKRPFTSSSMQQQMAKRNQGNKKQSSAIAALYLGPQSKFNHQFAASNGFNSYQTNEIQQQNQPILHTTPFQQKKRMFQNNSMPRKSNFLQPVFTQKDHELLYEEAVKVKQVCQEVREENHRLKMKVKMLEVEMIRKEKSLEDYLQQSTFIQNAQRNAEQVGQTMAPIAQTAQKYQQETYLVLSLKKQVKELKQDLLKNTEILEKWRRNAKVTRLIEMEAEIDWYKDEMQRMQSMINFGRGEASQIDSIYQQPQSQEELGIKFLPHTHSGQDTEEEIKNQSDPSSFSNLKYGEAGKERQQSALIMEIQSRDDQIQKLQEQVASLHGETMKKSTESKSEQSLKAEISKLKKSLKQEQEKATEQQKQLLELQKNLKVGKQAKEEADSSLKELNDKLKTANLKVKDLLMAAKIKDEKTKELEEAIGVSDQKIKQLQEKLSSVKSDVTRRQSTELVPKQKSGQVTAELSYVTPILAANLKINDRIVLAEFLKQGFPLYQPSVEVTNFLKASSLEEIAFALPKLALQKARLESYDGEESASIVATLPEELSTQQKQYIFAQHLVKINGMEVYINTANLKARILSTQRSSIEEVGRGRVGEEQLLDIAEVVFVRMADAFVKNGSTVRETFGKYAVSDLLPDQSNVLDLLSPLGFLDALKNELKMEELSEIEVACLMRVLAKPELENKIILNEFALIMENFGVPLVDQTILSEEEDDYIAEGAEKPKQYNLNNIDVEGLMILRQVARFLLSEYLHPREFFGKMIKTNVEVVSKGRTIRLDQLKIKDFYLKIKIANIRKTLEENQSLNDELCLDQVSHPTVFNIKWFVRALEDIAEVEQERLVEEERYHQAMLADEGQKQESELSAENVDYEDIQKKQQAKPPKLEDKVEKEKEAVKIEAPRFSKGKSRAGRSPNPISKFQALGTIEEAISENATSHPENISGDMNSNNLRFSNNIDSSGEIMPKVDLVSKSFNQDAHENHRQITGMHSTTSEQMRTTSEEMFSQLQVDIPEMAAAPISTEGSRRNDKADLDDYQDDQSFEEDN